MFNLFGSEINNLLTKYKRDTFKYKIFITCAFVTALTQVMESVFIPKIMANLFVNIQSAEILKYNILKLIFIWIFVQGSYSFTSYLNSHIEPSFTKFVTDELMKAIFIRYNKEHTEINTAIIFSKISLICLNIESLVNRLCFALLPNVIGILTIVLNLYILNNNIGICTFIVILTQFLILTYDMDKCIDITYDEIEYKDEMMNIIFDKFSNIETINTVKNGIDNEIKKCEDVSKNYMEKTIDTNRCIIQKQIMGYITNIISFTIILWFSYTMFVKNNITIEVLTSILLSIPPLFNHMYEISYYIPDITKKIGVLNNNKNFLKELFSYENKKGIDVEFKNAGIYFNNVTYSLSNDECFPYNINDKINSILSNNNSNLNIFENLTLEIEPNIIVALCGKSGTGKSTFIKLICDIIQPISGNIYIDNHDVKTLSKNSINMNISYVPQNVTKLFNTTIYENIIYGLDDSKILRDKIKKICVEYSIVDIFFNITKILDTNNIFSFFDYVVGPTGELLSGGQKQIIHIIRCLLNEKSKIIILDEPTSSLDFDIKFKIFDLIKYLNKQQRLILIITHDRDISNMCDKILYFEHNKNPKFVSFDNIY